MASVSMSTKEEYNVMMKTIETNFLTLKTYFKEK